MKAAEDVLRQTARAVTDLFLASDEDIRYALETGFPEHALETEALRPISRIGLRPATSACIRAGARVGEGTPELYGPNVSALERVEKRMSLSR
jgi:hypothetical protein